MRLRQLVWAGAQIADIVQVSPATVARTLAQLNMARLESLHERLGVVRYEWPRPGQLLHLDIKKLGRIGHIGHRITGDRRGQARGIGLTIARASPTPKSWAMKPARPWPRSSAAPLHGIGGGACGCVAC